MVIVALLWKVIIPDPPGPNIVSDPVDFIITLPPFLKIPLFCISPFTSKVLCGVDVPIPTLPAPSKVISFLLLVLLYIVNPPSKCLMWYVSRPALSKTNPKSAAPEPELIMYPVCTSNLLAGDVVPIPTL